MRVFHGISGAAGQPASITAALKNIGIDAVNFALGDETFGYRSDRRIEPGDNLHSTLFGLLSGELLDFDVYHLHFRPFFFDSLGGAYPMGLDLLLLRLIGKRVILNFRGSEVRLHSRFRDYSPFNYVDEDPDDLTSKFPEPLQHEYIRLAQAICNHVLVPDPELQGYVPESFIVPRCIDTSDWRPRTMTPNRRPLIVHAPSRRVVKGSEHVTGAVSELRTEGLEFDFELVEGLSNQEARQLYERADLIVDQLRIGWYGVLAVEGMALGKAVVSYVRDDLQHHLGSNPPLAYANPTTIKETLRNLIRSAEQRELLGHRARDYCERVHDARVVARQLSDIYEQPGNDPDAVDLITYFAHQHDRKIAHDTAQKSHMLEQTREIRSLERRLASTNQKLDEIKRKLAPLLWLRDRYRSLIRERPSS